jgi:hypothetical protein
MMATRGWEQATPADLRDRRTPTASKYRNVRTRIGDQWFDSKREADYWQGLKARERNGEITNLRRQVVYPLLCPVEDRAVLVSTYIADFTYDERGVRHVVDVKGVRTPLYRLKAKWLQLQDGITVEEVV